MIRFFLSVCIFSIAILISAEDAIIISHDGETIMVNKYTVTDEAITFTSVEGEKGTVPKSEVFAFLIRAKRSTNYSPQETKKRIAEAKRVFGEFPGLRKQLQPLLDEWLRVRNQAGELTAKKKAELQKEIDAQFDEYNNASMKDEEAYLKLRSNLEMVKYRDVRGIFEEEISKKLFVLGNRLIEKKAAEIDKQIEAGRITMVDYKKIKSTIRRMVTYYAQQDVKDGIKGLQNDAAAVCLKNELRATWGIFKDDRNGETYLEANTRLRGFEKEFNELPEAENKISALRTKMRDSLVMQYDFTNKSLPNYPLSSKDKKMLKRTFKQCSSITDPIADPVAIIFPTQPIKRLNVRKNEVVPIRAIFQEKPEGKLRLFIKPFNTVMKVKNPIKDNGLEIRFATGVIGHLLESRKDKKTKSIEVFLVEGDENKPLSNPISLTIR